MEVEIEQNISGEELYSRFLAGDKYAFESLVALYEDELALFINGIVHDYHEAKHLTIEAFAKLALKGKQFSGESSIKTYLFAIGKNLAVRYAKMRSHETHISYEDIFEFVGDESETPEGIIEKEESKRLINEAIGELKEDYRVVLTFLYFEDMSYIQAGRVMGKTERQIEGLARRAKASLKKKLESGGFGRD